MVLFRHAFHPNIHATLLRSGHAYFDELLKSIQEAKENIHLQVYIFELDTIGKTILDALVSAASRGVRVYIVVDAYASPLFTPELVAQLKHKRVFVKRFSPLHFRAFKIGRRLHHKIALFDEQSALIGGINIADKYHGTPALLPWLDLAVRVEGPVCADILSICVQFWPKRMRGKRKAKRVESTRAEQGAARIIQNDWRRRHIEISSSYNALIRNAKQELWVMASYFLPGFTKRRLLINAARRGVKVTLITGGHSDVLFMKPAIRYLYESLLKEGIRIFEWNKSVLHAKVAVADGFISSVGSHNLNALSDYGSVEANVELLDAAFAKETTNFFRTVIDEGCNEILLSDLHRTSYWWIRVYRWISYRIIRLSLIFLFILMRRDQLRS